MQALKKISNIFRAAAPLAVTFLGLTGCADWMSYNFGDPPTLILVQDQKLLKKYADGSKLEEGFKYMLGWKPDFCRPGKAFKDFLSWNPDYDDNRKYFNPEFLNSLNNIFDFDPKIKGYDYDLTNCVNSSESTPLTETKQFKSFLEYIDKHHSELLVDKRPDRDPRACFYGDCDTWIDENPNKFRPSPPTLSEEEPLALSLSVKRRKKGKMSTGHSDKTSVEERKAFVELTGKLLAFYQSDPDRYFLNKSKTFPEIFSKLELFRNTLDPVKLSKTLKYSPLQEIELTLSSVINSPDLLNRFDYMSTYLFIYPYPYPPNSSIDLKSEFWLRLRGILSLRNPTDKKESLRSDLNQAWKQMGVQIHSVETTVKKQTVDFGQVERKATQGLTSKVEAGAQIGQPMGTVGGEGKISLEGSSDLTVSVNEKLQRQLAQRSTWLNPERNLLRITQRGMEAVSLSGSIQEKIVLEIPAAYESILVIGKDGEKLEIDDELIQPLYSGVEAIAVTVGVVRQPFNLKRSAQEKFGLPDSADAYQVVQVMPPTSLQLWKWGREIYQVDTLDFLTCSYQKPCLEPNSYLNQLVGFYSSEKNRVSPLLVHRAKASNFVKSLKAGIFKLREATSHRSSTQSNSDGKNPEPILLNVCRVQEESTKAGNWKCLNTDNSDSDSYFFVNGSKDDPKAIWIGVYNTEESQKLSPFRKCSNPRIESRFPGAKDSDPPWGTC